MTTTNETPPDLQVLQAEKTLAQVDPIKPHPRLSAFTKKFEIEYPSPTVASTIDFNSDFWKSMNFKNNLYLDEGREHTIDVISDQRYIISYIIYHVVRAYPTLDAKAYPFVTPYSLVAYFLAHVHLHFYACDRFTRRQASTHANEATQDVEFEEFFTEMLRTPLPQFMCDLLSQIAPVADPVRPNLQYIPSYAAFSLTHDFGRFFPINLFLTAHDVVASRPANNDPVAIMIEYSQRVLAQFGNRQQTVSQYLGIYYVHAARNYQHNNWFNDRIFALFNFVTARSQTMRPTIGIINTEFITYPNNDNVNPYYYGLMFSTSNYTRYAAPFRSIGSFCEKAYDTKITHGQLLSRLSGSLILNHFVERFSLPTWTFKTSLPANAVAANINRSTDAEFADHNSLCLPPVPQVVANLDHPPAGTIIEDRLLHTEDALYAVATDPIQIQPFDQRSHIHPDVLYVQPYENNPTTLEFSIPSGIHIENADIDAFALPTEDPSASLFENNSFYFSSAVRIDTLVRPSYRAEITRFQPRSEKDYYKQAVSFFIGSFARSIFPVFANLTLPQPLNLGTYQRETGHGQFNRAFNPVSTTINEFGSVHKHYLYGWSSYRYIQREPDNDESYIFVYLSLRPFHGVNVLLKKSRHPCLILPSA
jgi:hypothetical protein